MYRAPVQVFGHPMGAGDIGSIALAAGAEVYAALTLRAFNVSRAVQSTAHLAGLSGRHGRHNGHRARPGSFSNAYARGGLSSSKRLRAKRIRPSSRMRPSSADIALRSTAR